MVKVILMLNNIIKATLLAKHEVQGYRRFTNSIKIIKRNSVEYKNLLELKNNGYTIIKDFIEPNILNPIVHKLDNFYKRPNLDDPSYRVGGARWQNIEIDFPELKKILLKKNNVKKIIKIYLENGINDFKKLVYQHSYYEKDLNDHNKKEIGLGRAWHCDTWKNEIKLMLFCTDIDETNGPLEVIPKSHNFLQNPIKIDYAKKIFSTIYPSKFNSDNLYFTINNESLKSRKIVGHKGSLAIFNTRCLHKASILKNGLRKVIWAYF